MLIRCRKLRKIKKELDQLRSGGAPKAARRFEQLAIRLGRQRHPRAKEPTYFSTLLSDLPPLCIPNYGGDFRPGTAKSCILDQLDDDVVRLDELCQEDEEDEEDEMGENEHA